MPRAAKAQSTKSAPKPRPNPGSAESVRRKTAGLEEATALLREARPLIERLEGELDDPNAMMKDVSMPDTTVWAEPEGLEDAIGDICAWSGIVNQLRDALGHSMPRNLSRDERHELYCLFKVIDRLDEAARVLWGAYYGDPEAEETEVAQ
jgi:hypothetical protein